MPREGKVVEGYEAGRNSLHEWVLLSKQINFSPVTCCKWDILGGHRHVPSSPGCFRGGWTLLVLHHGLVH